MELRQEKKLKSVGSILPTRKHACSKHRQSAVASMSKVSLLGILGVYVRASPPVLSLSLSEDVTLQKYSHIQVELLTFLRPAHIYYTLLSQVHSFAALFTNLGKLSKNAGHKPFYGAKPAFVQGHILSTGGDALAILC